MSDDTSNNYLLARQTASEFHSPGMTAWRNDYSRRMQEADMAQIHEGEYRESQKKIGAPSSDTAKELTGGVETPMIDPVSAFAGGFTGPMYMGLKAGMGIMPSLSKAMVSGVVGAISDYPIGFAAEEVVGSKYPALAVPFSVAAGMLSGMTIERVIENGINKGLSRMGKSLDPDELNNIGAYFKTKMADETGSVGPDITKSKLSPEELQDLQSDVVKNINESIQGASKNLKDKTNEVIRADIYGSESTMPQYMGNINKDYLDTPDKIKGLINLNALQFKAQIQAARRGTRTWEETERAAKKYDINDLLSRRVGEAYNAEQLDNARTLMVSSAENLQGMREKIRMGEASDLEKADFMQAFVTHYAILEQVSGATAEAGRALNIFKKMAGSDVGRITEIREFMKTMPSSPEQLADALSTFDSPIQLNNFVRSTMRATTKDMFFEAWINGLLSGPQTHAINMISNAVNSVWQIPERALAGVIGRVLPGEQAIKEKEALYQAYGLIHGFKSGMFAFGSALKSGVSADSATKLESTRMNAITAGNVKQLPLINKLAPNALEEGGVAARAVDMLGEVIRVPGRFLIAEDEMFKAVGYRMELEAQAFRTASNEGLTGKDMAARIKQITSDPETFAPEIHLASINAGKYQTFNSSLKSEILGAISKSKNPVVKIIAPFVRTPTNILKYGFERTPFAPLSKAIRAEISAGGARRDLALARVSVGSMIMASTSMYAMEGRITGGGPVDPKLRNNLIRQGWKPYSIKVGNKYIQYNRLEPLGMLMGVASDFAEISSLAGEDVDTEEIATAIAMSFAKNVTSKTWLQGASEFINMMEDPDRYGEKYVQNFVGSLVPSIVNTAKRAVDPESKAIYGMMDSVKSRIPGWSSSLLPNRDLWGEPITYKIGPGEQSLAQTAYSVLSPIYVSEGVDSPIDKELDRLKLGVGKPEKRQEIMGVSIDLTPELYDELIVLMNKNTFDDGKSLKDTLTDTVNDPGYKEMSDEDKIEYLKNMFSKAKKIAKLKLLDKHQDISETIEYWKQQEAAEQ